jgi:pimeloyl-ACP methyl ester carboxylesterase
MLMRTAMVVAVLVAAGCSSTRPGDLKAVQAASGQIRAGNVYLLRGWIGIFSEGIDDLTGKINQIGASADVFQDDQWHALAGEIRERYKSADYAEPLVLIGHSYGADDAIRIARELGEAGIAVDLLITLDPVTPPRVPGNVRICRNLYESNGVMDTMPVLRGVAIEAAPHFHGDLTNIDIRRDRTDLLEADTNHFNIEKNSKVHDLVLEEIRVVCPLRDDWLAMRAWPQAGAQAHAP